MHRVLACLLDLGTQVSMFWILNIALTLQFIASCIRSTLWLSLQPDGARTSYAYLTRLTAIWAFQQFLTMMLIPMLTLRKFNG